MAALPPEVIERIASIPSLDRQIMSMAQAGLMGLERGRELAVRGAETQARLLNEGLARIADAVARASEMQFRAEQAVSESIASGISSLGRGIGLAIERRREQELKDKLLAMEERKLGLEERRAGLEERRTGLEERRVDIEERRAAGEMDERALDIEMARLQLDTIKKLPPDKLESYFTGQRGNIFEDSVARILGGVLNGEISQEQADEIFSRLDKLPQVARQLMNLPEGPKNLNNIFADAVDSALAGDKTKLNALGNLMKDYDFVNEAFNKSESGASLSDMIFTAMNKIALDPQAVDTDPQIRALVGGAFAPMSPEERRQTAQRIIMSDISSGKPTPTESATLAMLGDFTGSIMESHEALLKASSEATNDKQRDELKKNFLNTVAQRSAAFVTVLSGIENAELRKSFLNILYGALRSIGLPAPTEVDPNDIMNAGRSPRYWSILFGPMQPSGQK